MPDHDNPGFVADDAIPPHTDLESHKRERPPASRTASGESARVRISDTLQHTYTRSESYEMESYPGDTHTNCKPHSRMSQSTVAANAAEECVVSEVAKDPWDIPELKDNGPLWSELSGSQKVVHVIAGFAKIIGVLVLLYIFIISLDLLSSSFRLIGGRVAGRTFQESKLLSNPVVGLMIGVLVTVVVQSSSTSTSITIAMVASGMLDVQRAVFIIMGANVGTTITNTLVSLAQSADRDQFRRAFAGATIHDMFNWLTVAVLLPLEAATGYLVHLTGAILYSWDPQRNAGNNVELLTAITKPLTHLFIQLNSKVIEDIAKNDPNAFNKSMIKETCSTRANPNQTCNFLFYNTGMGEVNTGIILLIISLAFLCVSLIGIVKILNSVLRGTMAKALRKALNTDFPGRLAFLTGYVAMLIGAGVTFLIQSSSVFTSALTPLVGLGVVSIDRMYPLTLGSNIGTTGTGLLAAMASEPSSLKPALQVALCHLFFNVTGILIWYPVPFMRSLPVELSKMLGNVTAHYRWFAIMYIILVFLIIPAAIIGLTLGGPEVLMGVGIPLVTLLAFIILVNVLQKKYPSVLPRKLRTWNFLPHWMHSLEPYDTCVKSLFRCRICCGSPKIDAYGDDNTKAA
ncbi:sodium-dependent phosphate transport protein 2B-like [Paramacrobiotus metropolitanus]|uniref:sodium-dependent phosphate transport protein 2B-like n=1 Tax=Paramacrobiotus metropolitanus TaxID=2943436 RepID=UPI0024462D42|nr:sodium-dependent phosphate transport protein 2B-like [Paramacrobiotus metropolitanus]